MRIVGLFLLALLAFAVTVIWKFPAAGVLPHVNIQPVKLSGVSGSIWKGGAQSVESPELTQPITNVTWKFQPATLLSATAGATVNFEVLGGKGEGLVSGNRNGDMFINDGTFRVPASRLEQFLPLPVAEFGGILLADIKDLELENNLLKRTEGTVTWNKAEVQSAVATVLLGDVVFDIIPQGEDQHIGKLSNTDGQLELSGEVLLDLAGNYKADILIKPTVEAPPQINNMLGLVGRQASDGSYRIRNNGNIQNLQL